MNRSALLELLAQPPSNTLSAQPDETVAVPADAGQFAVQGRLPGSSLSIEVEGLGPLGRPLPHEQGEALHLASAPAPFGWRDQTLLDPAVRHSGEISADQLGLTWHDGAFAALQQEVAQALGVERVEAWLHNLLIYGPGQFFKPHQDTEKLPRMVATLVLIWPSAHIGGELRAQLGEEEVRLASQQLHGDQIRWFAFYADCRHEVRPVEEGWRVALTFDLVLPAARVEPAAPPAATPLQQDLQAALRQQFALDGPAPGVRPWVLLLDHEYTEHGLHWDLLKGADRWRVAALRDAARALGLSMHLALAELHETWAAEPSYRPRRGEAVPAEPQELLEESLTLDFWVDEQGSANARNAMTVALDDTASYIETSRAHLVNEEYEGYMGNYGETLDYWYRRAALVIQSPLGAELTRFEIDFDAALADARALARQPASIATLVTRMAAANKLLSYQVSSQGRLLLEACAEIAAALPDAAAAIALMSSFTPSGFLPEDAAVLARLEQQRGTPWMRSLLKTWTDPLDRRPMWQVNWSENFGSQPTEPRLWPVPLPAFTQAGLDAGLSPALLDDWFRAHMAALVRFDAALASSSPAHRQALQPQQLDTVNQLAQAIRLLPDGGAQHLRALIEHVLGRPGLYVPEALAPFVLAVGPLGRSWPQDQSLRERVIDALHAALTEPERTTADHGLRRIEWQCRCQDCTSMITWAESPGAQPLVLAMAEPRRNHVQAKLQAAGAPIATATLRQGSPHKLVLSKPADLQARERGIRESLARDRARLQA
jgi:hypothetical protein